MKAIRLTKAEAEVLHEADGILSDGYWDDPDEPGHTRYRRAWGSLMRKLVAAEAPGPAVSGGVAVAPIEQALIAAANGKVVQLAGGYGRASRQAAAVKATPEDAAVIGKWLTRQGWLREPVTITTVLNKWGDWLARARATAPPPAAPEGYGSSATVNRPDGAGRGNRGGGRGEGFR